MSYKPTEIELMAYLYGELEGEEKERVERYLEANPHARQSLDSMSQVRSMLGHLEDQEVIAPPIFVGEPPRRMLWDAPYFKTIVSIAASVIIIMLVGIFSNMQVSVADGEFRLSFGSPKQQPAAQPQPQTPAMAALTAQQVQDMINASMNRNNATFEASLKQNQQDLNASIRKSLAANSGKVDELVRQTSLASQGQVKEYVASLRTENMQMVKDYFRMSSGQQKQYVEELLVDFAKYLQQQRTNDLQLVQTRLNSLEQNTSVFRQETEQILTSIISTVGTTPAKETKY